MEVLHLSPADDWQHILSNLSTPTTIYLAEGVYRGKTVISCDGVTVIGAGRETTVITYDDYARKIHADGREYNTFRTYTLCVTGRGVKLKNLTVENSNTKPQEVGQCVALSVNAKDFSAENVNLVSTQDTLFISPFPDDLVVRYRGFIPESQLYLEGGAVSAFRNCKICGTVDFIFGCGEAYFENCEIVSLRDERGCGFVAAPAHSLAQAEGFCFINCNFLSGGAEDSTCHIARPWRDFGKCAVIDCKLDKHIKPELFDKWNDTSRDKTARFLYHNLDCGFKPAPVKWCRALTDDEVKEILKVFKQKTQNLF